MMKQAVCFFIVFFLSNCYAFSQDNQPDSLDLMIGQMVMVGLNNFDDPGTRERTLDAIAEGRVSGIILFEKDLKKENTKKELAKLIWELQRGAKTPLFIGIDEEGGKVNRLKPNYGFPKTRSAQYLGTINNLDSTRYYATATASTLNQYGFNVNYAPTVDININPSNPVIGVAERSYSGDYEVVTRHAEVVIQVHDSLNVATVLKHFPGHGSSEKDTHLGIADVSNTWRVEELFPYKNLIDSGHVDAIMSSHIVNRSLDEQLFPATLSVKMIKGVLRGMLGFDGVVFSDDMHMGAISKHYGFEEAILLAIKAGVDVLMFSNNVFEDEKTSPVDMFSVIRTAVENGDISHERIQKSYERIMRLKEKLGLLDKSYLQELEQKLILN